MRKSVGSEGYLSSRPRQNEPWYEKLKRSYSPNNAKQSREARAADGWTCSKCRRPFHNKKHLLHSHHVVSKLKGGSDAKFNRLSLCFDCHSQEHDHLKRFKSKVHR